MYPGDLSREYFQAIPGYQKHLSLRRLFGFQWGVNLETHPSDIQVSENRMGH